VARTDQIKDLGILCHIKTWYFHLDYCSFVWSPYLKKEIEALEKVQKRATKILPQLKHINFSDRLKACKLPILHYRRIRGDMIETYKILTGKYDIETAPPWLGFGSQQQEVTA